MEKLDSTKVYSPEFFVGKTIHYHHINRVKGVKTATIKRVKYHAAKRLPGGWVVQLWLSNGETIQIHRYQVWIENN